MFSFRLLLDCIAEIKSTQRILMKLFILTISILFGANLAFADSYVCKFTSEKGKHKLVFDFDESQNRDEIQVTVYLNNRIKISHMTRIKVDSDSHADGWSMNLVDSDHSQYKYSLYFDALYLYSVYVTMPGFKEYEVENCERFKK